MNLLPALWILLLATQFGYCEILLHKTSGDLVAEDSGRAVREIWLTDSVVLMPCAISGSIDSSAGVRRDASKPPAGGCRFVVAGGKVRFSVPLRQGGIGSDSVEFSDSSGSHGFRIAKSGLEQVLYPYTQSEKRRTLIGVALIPVVVLASLYIAAAITTLILFGERPHG